MKRPTRALTLAALLLASCAAGRPSLENPDFAALRDGTYLGAAFIFPVRARVRLRIEGGRIEELELLRHFNGQGGAAEALIPRILEAQSIELEAVSGATHSSAVILKAVEKALSKAGG